MTHKNSLTKRLRVIRNAWHFCYTLVLVFTVVCRYFSVALLTP
ncbi:DUF3265 domain-containing protein [Vibrio vulnificus]|uniref:DUF3265 domain-containing protein n=1 Tax=Vibrio vulnificus TaxID=672 RepID=A0AAW4HI42_VIBVL|nr:DUF3265 domain-containing protein [Vibrio vulnificus]ELA3118086.1 DUF3265 domain-containing protein [Vibrio vulnificus]ELV8768190.1 DUF3265 domain-containing protein [Vibrio vulnificus]MBN8124431.1 DUF3265 domain-containing protein [Vibrio vulnificus]